MKNGVSVMTDPGIEDKRLLLDEREFYSALEVMKREGNILSAHRPRRLGLPAGAANADQEHPDPRHQRLHLDRRPHHDRGAAAEARPHLDGQRLRQPVLYGCVHRSKMLPFGGDALDATDLGTRTRAAIETARNFDRVNMTEAAMELWVAVYPQLSGEVPGLLGSLTARAEGQTIRLALIYALLDGAGEIDRVHLEAALAVWAFCDASTRFIFGDVTGDTMADAILRALRSAGATGKTRTELYALFSNNRRSGDIGRALELLMQRGKARSVTTHATDPAGVGGRPRPGTRSEPKYNQQ